MDAILTVWRVWNQVVIKGYKSEYKPPILQGQYTLIRY